MMTETNVKGLELLKKAVPGLRQGGSRNLR